jgi:ABC-type transport system substrate-binding protein
MAANIANFDPYNSDQIANIDSAWMEKLNEDDWTVNPAVFKYILPFRPSDYCGGQLAQTWEMTDLSTYVVHLHQGIHWQNISPVNGREFIADDVVYHFDRLFGLGDGFAKPAPYWGTNPNFQQLISVTATDKYTVVFKWHIPNPEFITENIQAIGTVGCIEPSEAVQAWGNLNDWHHAIGTGPFILHDFVSGSSASLVKNPNYWGYDERYPQNQLPYVDNLIILVIPDPSTALAGLRTGKIDVLDSISLQNALSIQKTNPQILQTTVPAANATSLDPRNDVAPLNDIRVREAMQMSIDLPTIDNTYYRNTCPPYPSTLTSQYLKGYGWQFDQWPQELKDQYAYNPVAAKKLLADAGYPNGFKTDIVADSSSDLDLLQIVKSYFAAVNIDMSITSMDTVSWQSLVQINHKQTQMSYANGGGFVGEAQPPINQLTRVRTGTVPYDYIMVSDPVFDSFYPAAMAATSVDAVKQILIDADKNFTQNHYVISLLHPNLFALYQPWFKGYSGQYSSISGGSGALMIGFYTARFWIDQRLKKSM